jgi:recombination protein RecA
MRLCRAGVDTVRVFSYIECMTRPALRLVPHEVREGEGALAACIEPGRLVELSGVEGGACGRVTTAIAVLRHVQAEGDTAAWIQPDGGPLYPPDLADAGIDLDALVVVHVPGAALPHGLCMGLCKAAELLLRSSAFGLVVVDGTAASWPNAPTQAWLGRVLGLARQHGSRVLLLTEKPTHADSLGTLVGLRVESQRRREPGGGFVIEHHVIKNKSGSPLHVVLDRYRGPDGTT